MKKLLLISLMFCFFSCVQEQQIDPNLSFFDLNEFIASSLQDKPNRNIKMMVELNGEEEIKEIKDYDMTKALEYLQEFNINKVKWYDKYELEKNNGMEKYTAIDESMRVREMIIRRAGNSIISIDIDYKNETIISDMTKKINWEIDRELSITNSSKSLLGKENNLKMAWKW